MNYKDIDLEQITKESFIINLENEIIYENIPFKLSKKLNKDKSKFYYYKCKFNRKDESIRNKNHLGCFCNSTLKAIPSIKNNNKGYIIII